MIMEAESAVLSNFDFLSGGMDVEDDDDMGDGLDNIDDDLKQPMKRKVTIVFLRTIHNEFNGKLFNLTIFHFLFIGHGHV